MGVYVSSSGDTSTGGTAQTVVSLTANTKVVENTVAFVTKAGFVIPAVVSDFACIQAAGTGILGPVLCSKQSVIDHPVYGIVFSDVNGGIVITNKDGTSRGYITPSTAFIAYAVRDDGSIFILEKPEATETLPAYEVVDSSGNVTTQRTSLPTNVSSVLPSKGDCGVFLLTQKDASTVTVVKYDNTNAEVFSLDVPQSKLESPVSGPYGTLLAGNTVITPKGSIQTFGTNAEVTVYPDPISNVFFAIDLETSQTLTRVDVGNVTTSMRLPTPVVAGVAFGEKFFYLDAYGSLRGISSIGTVSWDASVENGFSPDMLIGDTNTNTLIALDSVSGMFEVYDETGFLLTEVIACGLTNITDVVPQTDGTAVFLGAPTVSTDTTDGMLIVTKTFATQFLGIVTGSQDPSNTVAINVTKGIYPITPLIGKQSVTFPGPTADLPYGASGFLMGKTLHTSGV